MHIITSRIEFGAFVIYFLNGELASFGHGLVWVIIYQPTHQIVFILHILSSGTLCLLCVIWQNV